MLWTNEFNFFKNGDQRRSCAKVKLFDDISTNPAPPINNVDPTLTVKVPYSQGDITVFDTKLGNSAFL